jgi:hypothetical protein
VGGMKRRETKTLGTKEAKAHEIDEGPDALSAGDARGDSDSSACPCSYSSAHVHACRRPSDLPPLLVCLWCFSPSLLPFRFSMYLSAYGYWMPTAKRPRKPSKRILPREGRGGRRIGAKRRRDPSIRVASPKVRMVSDSSGEVRPALANVEAVGDAALGASPKLGTVGHAAVRARVARQVHSSET